MLDNIRIDNYTILCNDGKGAELKPRARAVKTLIASGYVLKRKGANHDIYYNDDKKCIIPLKRHDFDEDDLRYIEKEIRDNARRRRSS